MIGVSKKRGFVFVETIVVTAILLASLMLVYSLFVSNKNEENLFKLIASNLTAQ